MNIRPMLLAATFLAAPVVAKAATIDGVYIGALAGANFLQDESVNRIHIGNSAINLGNTHERFDTGFRTGAYAGYGFGNGLRAEIEGDFFENNFSRVGSVFGNNSFGGGTFVPSATTVQGQRQKYGGFLNVLYDVDLNRFGIDVPFTPYVGIGAGYLQETNQNVAFATGTQSLLRSTGTDGNFAYQGIVGISYDIPAIPGLAATLDYRFTSVPGPLVFRGQYFQGTSVANARIRENNDYNHTVNVGLRYAFNVAPPPVIVAPAPVPQTETARTYLVFFDWDRADLTDRARQIIAQAAQATTRLQVTRIEVNGNTDTTGTARYNQALSVRRAQNVAGELVRLGVPASAITTQGFGFSRPLVNTGPGVREPQNRRVEIILH